MPGTVVTVAGARVAGFCAATVTVRASAGAAATARILGSAITVIPVEDAARGESRARRGFADRGYGFRDNEIDANPTELGACSPRVAADAVGACGLRVVAELIGAHEVGIDGKCERSI